MGLLIQRTVNGKRIPSIPGYDSLDKKALAAHDGHMIKRSEAADKTDKKLFFYHSTAASLVVRKKRPLTQTEKDSIWKNKTKKYGNSNKERETYLFNKYPGLKKLVNK